MFKDIDVKVIQAKFYGELAIESSVIHEIIYFYIVISIHLCIKKKLNINVFHFFFYLFTGQQMVFSSHLHCGVVVDGL